MVGANHPVSSSSRKAWLHPGLICLTSTSPSAVADGSSSLLSPIFIYFSLSSLFLKIPFTWPSCFQLFFLWLCHSLSWNKIHIKYLNSSRVVCRALRSLACIHISSLVISVFSFSPSPGVSTYWQCSGGTVRSCLCVGSNCHSLCPNSCLFFRTLCRGLCLQEVFPFSSVWWHPSFFFFYFKCLFTCFCPIHLVPEFPDCVLTTTQQHATPVLSVTCELLNP